MRMALLVGALGLGIVGAGFAGCQSARPPAELATEMEAGPLAFLQDGQTSREQVLLRLGIPTADFEGQRILTYRLYYDPEHGVQVLPRDRLIGTEETVWTGVSSSLVLVFNDDRILARHSVVPMTVFVNK